MGLSEQESEKKGVEVSEREGEKMVEDYEREREREGILVGENGKCFRFYPSEREKARDVRCRWIKHLTQLHDYLPTKHVRKGGEETKSTV